MTVRTYPNQKPWITGNIHTELKGSGTLTWKLTRNRAMPSDEPSNRQSVNTGLRLNPTTPALTLVELLQGLKTITDYKGKPSCELPNAFYARFEARNTEACMRASAVPDDCVINLSIA